jgi:hypothetical protein
MNLNKPKTSKAEILFTLIDKGEVSIMDFPYLSSFRTRVSDLKIKDNLPLIREMRKGVNKFNNTYTYAVHRLNPFYTRQAVELYKLING